MILTDCLYKYINNILYMAKTNENILRQARERGLAKPSAGMSVPEGYFDAFAATMADKLLFRAELESPEVIAEAERPRTVWQKVRPMCIWQRCLRDVWCMLQMLLRYRALPPSLR